MAHPYDAQHFREIFGRALRRESSGLRQAFRVAPINDDMSEVEFFDRVEAIRRHLIQIVDSGEMFYVSPEITELLVRAADRLQKTIFHFEPDDFPSLVGSVYFDGPVPMPTLLDKNRQQSLRAILWGQMAVARDAPASGKVLYTVCDTSSTMRDLFGPYSTRHWAPVEYGVRYSADMVRANLDRFVTHIRAEFTDEERRQDEDDAEVSMGIMYRLLYVWSHFIKTEIMVRHPYDVDRNQIRVMKKEGRPLPQIRVVTLRRFAHGPSVDGEGNVEWSHRWIQRGHWRQQRVGPGRMMIRPVWIPPAVKGPADKPLLVRPTVQAVVR